MLLAADASLVSRAVEVACDDERADDDGADALAARAARMRRRRARVRALRLLNNVSASEGGARAVLQIGAKGTTDGSSSSSAVGSHMRRLLDGLLRTDRLMWQGAELCIEGVDKGSIEVELRF